MTIFTVTGEMSIASPFPEASYGEQAAVRLEDATAQLALIHVQGAGALDALAKALGGAPRTPGSVVHTEEGLVAAMRLDVGMALVSPGRTSEITQRISRERITVLDMSHGRGIMTLNGPCTARVLPKLCGLDFDERAFPHYHAAQTSIAKVRALIVRADEDDLPRYIIAVDRSHAAYTWGAILDAMQEFVR